jgi:hypothetical protein
MIRPGALLVVLAFSLAGGACARSRSQPAPSASASSELGSPSSTTGSSPPVPAPAGRIKLCSDGVHKPGDHWKEACNPCRCAADGDITCANFPCGSPRGPDAGDAAP